MSAPALIQFTESNGPGEDLSHGITNLNFGSVDTSTLSTTQWPLVLPTGSNTTYSYKKYFRFELTSMGDSNQVTALRFYKLSGDYVTGESIHGNTSATLYYATTYHEPDNLPPDAWMPLAVSETLPNDPNVSIDATGTPDDATPDSVSGALTNPSYSQYIILQTIIDNTASAGAVNQKFFRMQYDES